MPGTAQNALLPIAPAYGASSEMLDASSLSLKAESESFGSVFQGLLHKEQRSAVSELRESAASNPSRRQQIAPTQESRESMNRSELRQWATPQDSIEEETGRLAHKILASKNLTREWINANRNSKAHDDEPVSEAVHPLISLDDENQTIQPNTPKQKLQPRTNNLPETGQQATKDLFAKAPASTGTHPPERWVSTIKENGLDLSAMRDDASIVTNRDKKPIHLQRNVLSSAVINSTQVKRSIETRETNAVSINRTTQQRLSPVIALHPQHENGQENPRSFIGISQQPIIHFLRSSIRSLQADGENSAILRTAKPMGANQGSVSSFVNTVKAMGKGNPKAEWDDFGKAPIEEDTKPQRIKPIHKSEISAGHSNTVMGQALERSTAPADENETEPLEPLGNGKQNFRTPQTVNAKAAQSSDDANFTRPSATIRDQEVKLPVQRDDIRTGERQPTPVNRAQTESIAQTADDEKSAARKQDTTPAKIGGVIREAAAPRLVGEENKPPEGSANRGATSSTATPPSSGMSASAASDRNSENESNRRDGESSSKTKGFVAAMNAERGRKDANTRESDQNGAKSIGRGEPMNIARGAPMNTESASTQSTQAARPLVESANPPIAHQLSSAPVAPNSAPNSVSHLQGSTPLTETHQTNSELSERVVKAQEAMAQQIVRGVQGAIGSERSFVGIRLHPEALGRIYVQLTLDGSRLSAQITAQKESTRALLENQLNQLRSAFEDQNIRVERMTVSRESLENRSQQDQQRQSYQERPTRQQSEMDGRQQQGGSSDGRRQSRYSNFWMDYWTPRRY